MDRRRFLSSLGAAGAVALTPVGRLASAESTDRTVGLSASASAETSSGVDRVETLFRNSAFVNGSDITTMSRLSGLMTGPNFNADYIAKLKAGRVTLVSTSLVFWLYDDYHLAGFRVYDFYELLDRNADSLHLVLDYDDIDYALRNDKIGIVMHAHTPSVTDGDTRRLHLLHRLGLRTMGFSHQQRSVLAEGAGESLDDGDGGLSALGRHMIGEMNRLGMVVDLGHVSERTMIQAAAVTDQPIVVSHTCCRALSGHEVPALANRNISDEGIRAIAGTDGVVGIMALTPHLLATDFSRAESIALYVDHLEHVIKTGGIDHVGIGTETAYGGATTGMQGANEDLVNRLGNDTPVMETYKAVQRLPEGTDLVVGGMRDMAQVKRNLIVELIHRGYSDVDVAKILGLNWLRVYRQVFASASVN